MAKTMFERHGGFAKFIASLISGPASYSDNELARIHAMLNITPKAFEEMTMPLEETLEDFEFGSQDIASALAEIRSKQRCFGTQRVYSLDREIG